MIQGVTGAMTGVAVIAFCVRTFIRARIVKQIGTEDFLLVFAILCLITNTVLFYLTLEDQYEAYDIMSNGPYGPRLLTFIDKLPKSKKIGDAIATIWWLCLFSVKLAYLFFFRKLIDRLKAFKIWW